MSARKHLASSILFLILLNFHCLKFDFGSGIGELLTPGDAPLTPPLPIPYPLNSNDSIFFQAIIDSNFHHINFSPFFKLSDQVSTDSSGFIVGINIYDDIDTLIITDDFQRLSKLTRLFLNGLQAIENHSHTSSNLSLTRLGIFQNRMDSLPSYLFSLSKLDTLQIEDGSLKVISENIAALTNLKVLNLFHNKIETLPTTIVSLTNLIYFDIGRNHLCNLQNPILNFYRSKQHYFDTTQNCP